jgi:hypothetical protein
MRKILGRHNARGCGRQKDYRGQNDEAHERKPIPFMRFVKLKFA